jgi:glycosyltransferase involved in cell wall biosynthesis
MAKLSVCVITKNAATTIERCLQSVSWADECVVVDSGSTDATCTLAEACGAQVSSHAWKDWSHQKNYASTLAKHDWVLSLDADEWLPESAEKIIEEALTQNTSDAFYLGRRTLFLGKWIAHSGWYPDRQIRLFRKSVTQFEEVPVHEKVIPPTRSAVLPLDIWHESYTSLHQYFEKNRRYSTAQAAQQKDQHFLLAKLVLKPLYRFGQTYIIQRGFLDGGQGLLLAFLRSWYEFEVIRKIILLHRQKA